MNRQNGLERYVSNLFTMTTILYFYYFLISVPGSEIILKKKMKKVRSAVHGNVVNPQVTLQREKPAPDYQVLSNNVSYFIYIFFYCIINQFNLMFHLIPGYATG